MKNYIVTGAAGFIGSHLVENLLGLGHRIICIDNFNDYYDLDVKVSNVLDSVNLKSGFDMNLSSSYLKFHLQKTVNNDRYNLHTVDIRNKDYLDEIFSFNQIDMVINLAAMTGVRPSLEDPLLYEDVNVKGLMNLLEMCKKHGVHKFIQASSSSVYGNSKTAPFKETDIVDFAISPYAATKKSGEVMGHFYHSLYDIDMIQLRFFTVYGPRQRPDLAIHKFTKMILNGEAIPFYGDGSAEHNYTYIDDIIDGITKSIKYLENNRGVYEIFNLGESQTISLNTMVKTIEDELGIKAKLNRQPLKPGDVQRTNADISKAKKMLGYSPSTDFNDGIRKFIEWYKK